jgi:L-threonylcarbamoyladenylate synthase
VAVVAATPDNIDRAAGVLREGGLVAIPTETVYGLAACVFDPRAVARIFEVKRRPEFDPLIVHVFDEAGLARVACEIPDGARKLMDRFWPGPLSLVLPKRPEVPSLVTAGLDTVAVRMPSHPVARRLLERCGVPLAAPSANPFGYLSPTRAEHVDRMLGDRVEMILDGGPTEHGLESAIVMAADPPVLLRPGAIGREAIEEIVGPLWSPARDATPLAPGSLPQHYAPRTPIRLVEFAHVPLADRSRAAALAFSQAPEGYAHARVLSASGDLREAAARLFELLHELDATGAERIDAEGVPERGVGVAIMDRLKRAAPSF